jgi:hypothetical protein
MAVTHKLIQTITVGSAGAASIEFGSIPQTYTDLMLVVSGRSVYAANATAIYMRFNNDTGTNYSRRRLHGSGSSVLNGSSTDNSLIMSVFLDGASSTASVFSNASVYIPNYAGSTQKSVSTDSATENNATEAYTTFQASLWTGTAAITSITILGDADFAQYTSASLYGIKNS